MHSWFRDFSKTLKHPVVEGYVDLYVFRPLAYPLVKLACNTGITPNQLTFFSMILGMICGGVFALGPDWTWLGGLLFLVSHTIDCADGAVARIMKNGTPMGRIVDGLADYVVSAFVLGGLAVGFYRFDVSFPVPVWLLMILTAASLAVHSKVVDHYRNGFLAHGLGHVDSAAREMEVYTRLLAQWKRAGRYPTERLLITLYLGYLRTHIVPPSQHPVDARRYFRANVVPLKLWTFIGPSTYPLFLVLAALAGDMSLFFIYTLIFGNGWLLLMLAVQAGVHRRLVRAQ